MPIRWNIHEVDGEFEVHQGAKRKRIWPTLEAALRWLGGKVTPGDRVYLVEPDGYHVDITRRHFFR